MRRRPGATPAALRALALPHAGRDGEFRPAGRLPAPGLAIAQRGLAAGSQRLLRSPIGDDVLVDLGIAGYLDQLDRARTPVPERLIPDARPELEALVGVYAHEIEDTSVRANLISPGPIRTELRVEAWPEEDPESVPLPEALGPAIVTMLSSDFAQNGVIFDFKSGRYTRCRAPA